MTKKDLLPSHLLLALSLSLEQSEKRSRKQSLHLARKLVPYGLLYINISSVSPSNKYIQLLFHSATATYSQCNLFSFTSRQISFFLPTSTVKFRQTNNSVCLCRCGCYDQCIAHTPTKQISTTAAAPLLIIIIQPQMCLLVVFTRP